MTAPQLPSGFPVADLPLVERHGYEPVGLVGQGAWADVWQVRHRHTGNSAAWKRLRDDVRTQPVARQLLKNEAEVGQTVRSQHVIRVLSAELDNYALLLEWQSGSSLEQLLQRRPALAISQALWVARQTAQGVADLAAAGYVHGDLKPQNILVDDLGGVKLIDLGFARRCSTDESVASSWIAGTPEYLAPEALNSQAEIGPGRDLYSLGVILYRMLSGKLPFQGESLQEILRQQRQSLPPPLKPERPETPVEVVRFVESLLAKHPIRRPASPARIVDELFRLELSNLTVALAG